jgi:quercetin dioxygenase-like cupin family protein
MSENLQAGTTEVEARDLKGLLQYQEGSVVSRILLKNSGGNVTLFAFAKGEGLSEHTAPFDALVIGVDGEAEIVISGKAWQLREGESIVMPAREPHSLYATTDFKMILVMIKAQEAR